MFDLQAAQMRIAIDFEHSQRTTLSTADPDPADQLDSRRRRARQASAVIGTQLAVARRESPHAGAKFLRTAQALVNEMPNTFAALERGRLSEFRASIVVKETAAYRIDPEVVTERAAYAVNERCVSIRPAPDTMAWLSALLPVAQGVAAYASDFWLRRLYTHPSTGQLVAMDSKARFFPAGLAKLITLRDQHCRTPWCNAPIRQRDHVTRKADGGETSPATAKGCASRATWPRTHPTGQRTIA